MLMLVVAAALFDPAGRVLVQRRPDDRQHGGLWEFPGGKVEPGESPEQALVREVAEELDITVAGDAIVPLGFSTGPGIVLLLYRCGAWAGEPVARDGATIAWRDPGDIDPETMPPADRPLLLNLAPSRS